MSQDCCFPWVIVLSLRQLLRFCSVRWGMVEWYDWSLGDRVPFRSLSLGFHIKRILCHHGTERVWRMDAEQGLQMWRAVANEAVANKELRTWTDFLTGFIWFRIGCSGRLLWTWLWTLVSVKGRGLLEPPYRCTRPPPTSPAYCV
jgi:hypothetical protein